MQHVFFAILLDIMEVSEKRSYNSKYCETSFGQNGELEVQVGGASYKPMSIEKEGVQAEKR